jgi:peptide-methionine (S)-S-oxide reductase
MTHPITTLVPALATIFALAGCNAAVPSTSTAANKAPIEVAPENRATAVFAGGCFWCMEKPFDQLPGVVATTSGYIGGQVDNPSYEAVSGGGTGHIEAVEIVYDRTRITYKQLLDTYWQQVDPFDAQGQFCDKGTTYVARIFTATPEETAAATASKAAIAAKFAGQSIAVDVLPASKFWPAEDYHQDYYLKNPVRYAYYRNGCGRDARLKAVWGEKAAAH